MTESTIRAETQTASTSPGATRLTYNFASRHYLATPSRANSTTEDASERTMATTQAAGEGQDWDLDRERLHGQDSLPDRRCNPFGATASKRLHDTGGSS